MKKLCFKIIAIFIILFSIFINFSYATNDLSDSTTDGIKNIKVASEDMDSIIGGADNFIASGESNVAGTISQDAAKEAIDLIYNVLLAVGLVVAVVAGIILGIQFMTSSADGQAQVKEKFVPYVVGCVIIFGAFGIWKLVMVLLQGF